MKQKTQILGACILGIFMIGIFQVNPSQRLLAKEATMIHGSATSEDFSHVKQINIEPATPVADYTIRLDLNATFDYAACQADGDDVRFFDNADAPLSFWTEKWTSGGDSIIWVNIPTTGTTSIKMAYGNATIGSGSNGEATFPLFDDFSGATINSSKWTAEDDDYSTVTIVDGKAHIRSLSPNPIASYAWMGFSDWTINHEKTDGQTASNVVCRGGEQLQTMEALSISRTTVVKNQTWILLDYHWIDALNAVFYENETIVATHAVDVPDVSLPVLFATRSLYSGPGLNYGGLIRSSSTFSPGYAMRATAYFQYDYSTVVPCTEPLVDVDWVFVRKCSSVESVASILSGNDTVLPLIITSGYSGSTVEQGNVEYLSWTIHDAHPSMYVLLKNGLPIQSNSYSSGDIVSIQIDSSALGQVNYTMIANDTFGNVGRYEKLITVQPRTDGGIEDFESLSLGNIDGQHGPLGTWSTSITGSGQTATVATDGGSQVLQVVDNSSSGYTHTFLNFDSNLAIGNVVSFRHKLSTLYGDTLLFMVDGTNYIHITLWQGDGHIRYTDPGNYIDSGVDFQAGVYETFWINFYSTTHFKLYVGPTEPVWSAVTALPARNAISTGAIIDTWEIYGAQVNSYTQYIDDITIDRATINMTVNSPLEGQVFSNSNVFLNVSVICPSLDEIWYRFDSGVIVSMPSNTSIAVADGAHSITFYANDTLGNINSVTRIFTVDTAAPVVEITSPSDGATLPSGTVEAAFTATDLTKDDTWYTVDGGASTIVTGSSFSVSPGDGSHTIVVYCNDSLGRIGSDSVSFTIDTVMPSILIDGFAGLSLQQGDVQYLNWTLSDAHPATYALRLNGQVVRSGSYGTSTVVSILIDSSTLGQLNYNMTVQDTFGNVASLPRQITVLSRIDGGIFLTVGVNSINRNASQGIFLTLDMSHWAVLYLDLSITVAPTSLVLPAALPSGLVVALPVAFNLNITNSSALADGHIRIYYSQSTIANQVDENTMVPMRWDEGTSSWVTTTSGLSRTDNYVDIPLSENGLYVIAAKPKENYIPILIIVLIGVTGGIVAVAGYSYSRKKSQKVKGIGTSKGKASAAYSPIPSGSVEQPIDEAYAKRTRLMKMDAPGTSPQSSAGTLFRAVDQQTGPVEVVKKTAKASTEPDVNIAARAASAQGMASEVSVDVLNQRCVVHKGVITGFSYTCKNCGTVYCMECIKHLVNIQETCWTCKQPLDTSFLKEGDDFPKKLVSMFSTEIWQKLKDLDLNEEIFDEVLGKLKSLPPEIRLKYLDERFPAIPQFDPEF